MEPIDEVKAYIGYSRAAGPQEGACLIFAFDRKEARKLAANVISLWFTENWTDVAVRRLYDLPEHLGALCSEVPSVIEEPPLCERCELWGGNFLDSGGCDLCSVED